MQAPIMKGKVYLMGAGLGAPELLTSQAVRVLRAAEVVLYDDQVSPEILELIPASAQVRNIHKLGTPAGSLQKKFTPCSSQQRMMDIMSCALE